MEFPPHMEWSISSPLRQKVPYFLYLLKGRSEKSEESPPKPKPNQSFYQVPSYDLMMATDGYSTVCRGYGTIMCNIMVVVVVQSIDIDRRTIMTRQQLFLRLLFVLSRPFRQR